MVVIANVFRRLQIVKDLVKPLSRKRRFTTSFDSQRVNGCETLLKIIHENIFIIFFDNS